MALSGDRRTQMPFGKYKGTPIKDLKEINPRYIHWLFQQSWFHEKYSDVGQVLNGTRQHIDDDRTRRNGLIPTRPLLLNTTDSQDGIDLSIEPDVADATDDQVAANQQQPIGDVGQLSADSGSCKNSMPSPKPKTSFCCWPW